jgi:nitroreductase
LVSDLTRVWSKYDARSYRFAHVDIGIMAGNAQLYGETLGLNSVMIAGYLEHEIIDNFKLGEGELPLLVMAFGKKKNA